MRVTQGCFSFLKDLSDDQITKQVEYIINKGWAISIEWTDDPHPRNTYWELWGLPLFDIKDPAAVLYEVNECRRISPAGYIKINAFDATINTESCVMSFLVQRPKEEPGFYLGRTESASRMQTYSYQSYAVNAKPANTRY